MTKAYEIARHGGGGVNKTSSNDDNDEVKNIKWRIGELEWEAWMRLLDCCGYKTGHIYRQPHLRAFNEVKQSMINSRSDVAEPPALSAVGLIDGNDSDALIAYRLALLRKDQEKAKWLNSPVSYQKVHIYETGTNNPKIITKWVENPESQNGTPVKINNNHQFSPLGTNTKEFKEKQKEIKENRRAGVTSAGPQSALLESLPDELILNNDVSTDPSSFLIINLYFDFLDFERFTV